ncbi:CTD nuclear envelope phosphatase 1-like [Paramacrobiotus metropolitanus]|uniref:CTD nuclear envelope phosphatase 1-like n=1 Tax=Paramacrobiotus metropolitanus TaxID=2943436 RepID=UPI002445E3A8|nr:CTD nuclear envelope phosphatase 1-like [Paramacrobiotus metropolitanus]
MATGEISSLPLFNSYAIQELFASDYPKGMSRSQCGSTLRKFWAGLFKIWSFFVYIFQKQYKTIVQHQTVKYPVAPLSPLTSQRLLSIRHKILVLDLDETLIHSTHDGVLRPNMRTGNRPPDFVLKVVIERHPVSFFVHKRPHVEFFLQTVSQWYELVVFTASMEIYGSAVSDKLDGGRNILNRRYFRQHCTQDSSGYTKDLSSISSDLSSIFIIDNSPIAYKGFVHNALPISSWYCDPKDMALLDLLPFLDSLRFTRDVRTVLSRHKNINYPLKSPIKTVEYS